MMVFNIYIRIAEHSPWADNAYENIMLYTDGLVEAHNPAREMFGFPRLQTLLAEHSDGASLIDFLLDELKDFTGEGWEQEDDLTLLILQRTAEQPDAGVLSASETKVFI